MDRFREITSGLMSAREPAEGDPGEGAEGLGRNYLIKWCRTRVVSGGAALLEACPSKASSTATGGAVNLMRESASMLSAA